MPLPAAIDGWRRANSSRYESTNVAKALAGTGEGRFAASGRTQTASANNRAKRCTADPLVGWVPSVARATRARQSKRARGPTIQFQRLLLRSGDLCSQKQIVTAFVRQIGRRRIESVFALSTAHLLDINATVTDNYGITRPKSTTLPDRVAFHKGSITIRAQRVMPSQSPWR